MTDLLIAATAHAHAARLYIRNPDDVAGLENLIDISAADHPVRDWVRKRNDNAAGPKRPYRQPPAPASYRRVNAH